MHPRAPSSIVVLTKDEATNIRECLQAVLAQMTDRDEVLVIDAASRDGTVAIAREIAAADARVRLHESATTLTFGAARNLGVAEASHDVIVFLSADAVPEAGWLDALLRAMDRADIAYGKQRHAPTKVNLATVSRGLRYRHFESSSERDLPERFASNVNAAYRRFAFASTRFDELAAGAEDVAFARQARLAGARLVYVPEAVVRHKDVATFRAEWRKSWREGAARAQLRAILGAPTGHLAWAFAVAGLALLGVVAENVVVLVGSVLVFLAPTLRRLASPAARRYGPFHLVGGAAASPLFDLAFLVSYLRRRVGA